MKKKVLVLVGAMLFAIFNVTVLAWVVTRSGKPCPPCPEYQVSEPDSTRIATGAILKFLNKPQKKRITVD